jgi:hypothetical protein
MEERQLWDEAENGIGRMESDANRYLIEGTVKTGMTIGKHAST